MTLAVVPPEGEQLVFAALTEMERSGAFRPCALRLEKEIPFDQYEALGAALGDVRRRTAWYIGDWLNYGEGVYGERWSQALGVTGLDQHTLSTYAYVCAQIPETRRMRELSFSHHRHVAKLTSTEQTYWLKKAKKDGWTADELRRSIDAAANKDQGQLDGTAAANPSSFKALVCEVIVRVRDEAVEDVSGQGMTISKETFARLVSFVEED